MCRALFQRDTCLQNSNSQSFLLLVFFVVVVVFDVELHIEKGGYSFNYQLNSHCLCLPEMRGSPYYLLWMVTCHLCLLLSPCNWILVCKRTWPQCTWQPLYWNAACPHTALAMRMEGKQRKMYSGPPFSDLVNWGQFKDVWVLWRLKQIGFWELIVYFVNITPVCKCMLS